MRRNRQKFSHNASPEPVSWLVAPDFAEDDPIPPAPVTRLPRFLILLPFLVFLGLITVAAIIVRAEMHTSKLQAEWLSFYAGQMKFAMQPGPSKDVRAPSFGPYNQRLGYSYLPFFIKSMQANDYDVAAQMRVPALYRYFIDRGLYPIYEPKSIAGLTLYDRVGQRLFTASYPNHVFASFTAIPPLLVNTLLFIENRELLKDGPVTRNPVIEWDRFIYAIFGHVIHAFLPNFNAGGGSTLATQTEKFRFSPGGQTSGAMEKLKQIASASLRVYMHGSDTRKARQQIVLDYLNSTPLGARPGFGEVNSIGDGLWAWFGIDLNDAATALNLPENDGDSLRTKAGIYRAALGLVLAQRRPSYYLQSNRNALDDLTDATLDRLKDANVITLKLRDAAKSARFHFLTEAPSAPQPPYIEQKAVTALRTHLMTMLGLRKLYEVDRLDLNAVTTLDQPAQAQLVDFLKKMGDRDFLQSIGLYGFRLLDPANDPAKIKWSVVLFERGTDSNRMRLQADNIDAPFDMNEGMKLDLGSTAKLRTLVTYLEIMGELYRRYAGLSADDLQDMTEDAPDQLSLWAETWLKAHPDASLDDMLAASMDRQYSGNPGEVFFTGGGAHTFVNFERSEDFKNMNLHEAFRDSVNLVFIRVMRDIVNYTIAQGAHTKQELLDDADEPARQAYLERFADQEGAVFLNRYISDFADQTPDQIMDKLLSRAHKGATSRTILFRSMFPNAEYSEYAAFMINHPVRDPLSEDRLARLYHDYPIDRYNLSDRAYITGLNPLELWLAGYLVANPHASRRAILEVSQPLRIESYGWLFRPSLKHAQDTRIRIMLEEDAFAKIQKRWARLGYPFERLVPSFATAIGSSADRPGALAELVGIILNDGVKLPTIRFESLSFGDNTPYQTLLLHDKSKPPQQVLDPAIAHTMKSVMAEVVDNGTAKRVRGVYKDAAGNPLPVGGKTGTGDHRYDEFGPGGRLISSRVVNRTGTFVFYLGDHFFGTITAHVAGEEAGNYTFTSALSAQMLKALAPIFQPLIDSGSTTADGSAQPTVTPPTTPVTAKP
jgi:membrane peptidoglycan carboxypeptidase